MGMKPDKPKVAPVGAPAQSSSLDIKRAQEEEKRNMRGRFGYQNTVQAGQSSNTTLG